MRRAIHVDSSEQNVRDLVALLHQDASADEFARRLAEVAALPPSYPGKSALIETVRMAMAVATGSSCMSSANAACWR